MRALNVAARRRRLQSQTGRRSGRFGCVLGGGLVFACMLGCFTRSSESPAQVPATRATTNVASQTVLLATAADPEPGEKQGEWPSFRNGPQLLGIASSKLPDELDLLWRFEAGEMVTATAAIVDGRVYAASLGGEVFCLDLSNGNQIWSYRSVDSPDPKVFAPGFKSSPTVTADSVYLGDEDGVFHAIDRATGKKRWTFATKGEIVSSPWVTDTRIIFGSHDNSLYCLKLDGTKDWEFPTQGYVNCSPAISGHHTFVTGCDEHLRVIDVSTGKEQTDMPLGTYLIASPAVVDNMLYVGTYASEVVAVDWKEQKKIWTYKAPKQEFPYHSSAAVTDKLVLVGSRDKSLHCIDRATGEGVWKFTTRGKVDSSPVVVGERVFVGSTDGHLYCLRLNDGQELWKFKDLKGKGFTASPAVGEGRLVIGSESDRGYIYCFGKKTEAAK